MTKFLLVTVCLINNHGTDTAFRQIAKSKSVHLSLTLSQKFSSDNLRPFQIAKVWPTSLEFFLKFSATQTIRSKSTMTLYHLMKACLINNEGPDTTYRQIGVVVTQKMFVQTTSRPFLWPKFTHKVLNSSLSAWTSPSIMVQSFSNVKQE